MFNKFIFLVAVLLVSASAFATDHSPIYFYNEFLVYMKRRPHTHFVRSLSDGSIKNAEIRSPNLV